MAKDKIDPDILKILKQAMEESFSVLIKFPEDISGKTAIIHLDEDTVTMKEIQPQELCAQILPGTAVEISIAVGTGQFALVFSSQVMRFKDKLKKDFLIAFPETIDRLQRRKNFRVSPSNELPLSITAFVEFPDIALIRLINISRTGLALSFPFNPDALFKKKLLHFTLNLGRFGKLPLEGRTFSFAHLDDNRCHVGIHFENISSRDKDVLTDYVNGRQREELRKKREKVLM